MMRGYAETDGCRRRFILDYFGERAGEARCGMCDNDRDRPQAPPEDEPADLPAGLGPGSRVIHPRFGAGLVTRVEADRLTVAFDEEGYRTLDAGAVVAEGLLEPA